MSNDSTVWNILPENSTEIPSVAQEQQDGHELLLVILSVLLVGSLISLAVFLLACRRCWPGGQCYARAGDDPEKTNSHYAEESRPTHEITIRVDESDCLSMASCHNQETERFLSTGTMGRRVSFNEAALFDHSKKAQEKGRRYTLTEGDFHHLKNARLTHLHIPPPGLKIVTIHECDSAENTVTMTTRPVAKSALSIFQPMLCPLPQTALTGLSVNPGCALPGDALNSVLDTSFGENAAALGTKQPTSSSIEMMMAAAGPRGRGSSVSVGEGAGLRSGAAGSQGPVLQFFTKLRRHASLEGASPYFKIKKWKLDSSQRASSLDTRGSPKRRQFQRQRAASESMDQDDNDAHHIDLIQYFARTQDDAYGPADPKARLLPPPSAPPPSLGRVEVEVTVEPSCGRGGPGVIGLSPDPQDEALSPSRMDGGDVPDPQNSHSLYKDIWTLRATLERYAASDRSSGNNDRNSVCSDAESVCSQGGRRQPESGELPSFPSQDLGDESEGGEDDKDVSGYVDERFGATEARKRKQDSTESRRGGGDAETGNRKLLQMDSGYASIEAPSRGPEDLRLFGGGGGGSPKDRTANEKRHHFTHAGPAGTVGESFECRLSEEEPEDEFPPGASGGVSMETGAGSPSWVPRGQVLAPRAPAPPSSSPPPPALHRRDYSIDEKTDALFHEFLRHDPQFDQQESPLRKHRSRVHLRKQWQRHKQWSDPGVRHFQSSFDRLRAPLRRGDSVNCPLDTGYHSTLPRIVSAPDEEAGEGGGVEPTDAPPPHLHPAGRRPDGREEGGPAAAAPPETPDEGSPPRPPDSPGYGPQTITAELSDKLAANLDDRLYAGLRRARDAAPAAAAECVVVVVAAAAASPDHSPV